MEQESTQPDPASAFELTDVPTAAQYKEAFLACRAALKSKGGGSRQLEMLRAHYRAPDRTLTPGELADQVDLANYKAANLVYNAYAKVLCEHFGREPKFGGKKLSIAILVSFSGGKPGEEFVRWTLRPEVAKALEELAWVTPER